MDYVTRQFIVIANKLLKEVRQTLATIQTDLKRLTEAITSRNESAQQNEQPQLLPPILRAELHLPEDKDGTKKTREDRAHRIQVWIVIGTWATFISASIYAYVAIRQWREMISARRQTAIMFDENKRQFKDTLEQIKGQTKAQQDATNVARNSLEVSQRAYLIIGISSLDYANRKVFVTVTNTGHIPPNDIATVIHESTISFRADVRPGSFGPARIEEMHWSKQVIKGQMPMNPIDILVQFPRMDVTALKDNHQQIIIVGTITYNDGFPNTPEQVTPICFTTLPNSSPVAQWTTCDWRKQLSDSEKDDKYPSEQYRTPN